MLSPIKKENCCGCFACVNICPSKSISMEEDNEGFWYPAINHHKCTNCGLCETVCPILNKKVIENEPKYYVSFNKNNDVRMLSSSGGLFSLFAEQFIHDKGIIFGACFDSYFKVRHTYVETNDDIDKLRGSKYVQSRIENMYRLTEEYLKQGRPVMFTGTPCQIGGLKAYLQKDYANLFCVDIVCHGVPSPKLFAKYVSYQENCADSKIGDISFRRKNMGWKNFSVSISFSNGTEYSQVFYKDLYMRTFLQNICLRPSCYHCKFKTLNRESDITLADFWGVQNISPEFDDDKGISLIFVNSIKGKSIFDEIKNQIFYKEVDINKAISYNSSAIKSVELNPKRKEFFSDLDHLSFNKLVKRYCNVGLFTRLIRAAKSQAYLILKK